MQARADLGTEWSSQRKLRRALSIVLVGLLFAALTPTIPAKAAAPSPWNQEGSSWQGTITTELYKLDRTNYPYNKGWGYSGDAVYSEISSMSSTANGYYSGHMVGSGTYDQYMYPCNFTGKEYVIHDSFSVDEYSTVNDFAGVFELITTDEGVTHFRPFTHTASSVQSHTCTKDGSVHQSTRDAYGWGWGDTSAPHPAAPLPDEDPDPLHLIGERTWTLEDPPFPMSPDHPDDDYRFTVTYDLRLVDNRTCRPVNTSFIAHLGDADGDPHDMLRYTWGELEFCYGPKGVEVVSNGTQNGELLDTGALTTALDTLGQKFKYANSDPVTFEPLSDGSIEAEVTGKFKFCTQIPLVLQRLGASDHRPPLPNRRL